MNRSPSLIDLPFVEIWLMPTIFILIVGLLALLDSQPSCASFCSCIERTL